MTNPLWRPRYLFPALFAVLAVALFAVACGDDDDPVEVPTPGGDLRQRVHWHADLALVVEGEPFDFGQEQFLSTEEVELSSNVHVHNPRHSVVHVHREQTIWDEFFASLGMKVTDTCITFADGSEVCEDDTNRLTFIVNGVEIDSIRLLEISNLQRVLIWYGPETADEILPGWESHVSNEACITSGLCLDRIDPNEPPEPCSTFNDTCN